MIYVGWTLTGINETTIEIPSVEVVAIIIVNIQAKDKGSELLVKL